MQHNNSADAASSEMVPTQGVGVKKPQPFSAPPNASSGAGEGDQTKEAVQWFEF